MARTIKKDTQHDEAAAENEGMPPSPGDITFTIKTPVNFKGRRAGVEFRDGKGETNDPCLATWFKGLGYEVSEKE